MKRDLEVIQKILQKSISTSEELSDLDSEGVDRQSVYYHIQLIESAGLAVCSVKYGGDTGQTIPSSAVLFRLVNKGHDLAEALSNESVWKKVQSKFIIPSAQWTLSNVATFAFKALAKELGLE